MTDAEAPPTQNVSQLGYIDVDEYELETFGIKVPRKYLRIYRYYMTPLEQRRFREILREFFKKYIEERSRILQSKNEKQELTVNVQLTERVVHDTEEDVLKLLNKIKRLESELQKYASKYIESQEQIEKLQKELEESKKKCTQSNQAEIDKYAKALAKLMDWLLTAYYCIEYSDVCKKEDVKKNIMSVLSEYKVDNVVIEKAHLRFKNLYTKTE
ncbi:MAG: hypothetical protein QXT64_05515 [Desulfurococcaceae archaeon]